MCLSFLDDLSDEEENCYLLQLLKRLEIWDCAVRESKGMGKKR